MQFIVAKKLNNFFKKVLKFAPKGGMERQSGKDS